MREVKIYALCEPGTETIRYVGKTLQKLKYRLREHIREKGKNHKCNWIQSLVNKGSYPTIIELETCNEEDWEWTEVYWIGQCRQWGFNLTNYFDGGLQNSDGNKTKLKELNGGRDVTIYNVETKEFTNLKSINEVKDIIKARDQRIKEAIEGKNNYILNGYIIGLNKENCLSKLPHYINRPTQSERFGKKLYSYHIKDETFEYHESLASCALFINGDSETISTALRNSKKGVNSNKGYVFGYTKEECIKNKEKYLLGRKRPNTISPFSIMTKKIICVETQEVFKSVKEAAIKFNADTSSISKCCKGKLKTTAKHSFKYI